MRLTYTGLITLPWDKYDNLPSIKTIDQGMNATQMTDPAQFYLHPFKTDQTSHSIINKRGMIKTTLIMKLNAIQRESMQGDKSRLKTNNKPVKQNLERKSLLPVY